MTSEQLAIPFEPVEGRAQFRPHLRRQAQALLDTLGVMTSPYALKQSRWDSLRHMASNPNDVDRHYLRMVDRGRMPFTPHTMSLSDELRKKFGIPEGTPQSLEFFSFIHNPKPSLAKGKQGKRRQVHAPGPAMALVQRLGLVPYLGEIYDESSAAYGLSGDRSFIHAAMAHAGNRYFCTMDIKSAYDAIDPVQLAHLLARLDPSQVGPIGWHRIVRKLLVPPGEKKGIATGANASPLALNIYLSEFDRVISTYAAAYGMTYTRYMDDLTLSAPDTNNPDFDRVGEGKTKFVTRALGKIGMKLNFNKIRRKDIKTEGPVLLPGTQIDYGGLWRIPEYAEANIHSFYRSIHKILDRGDFPTTEQVGQVHGVHGHVIAFIRARVVEVVFGNAEIQNPNLTGQEALMHDSELGLFRAYHALKPHLPKYNYLSKGGRPTFQV